MRKELDTPEGALHNSQFAVRSSQFAVRSSQFAVRSSQFAVRSSQFAVRSRNNSLFFTHLHQHFFFSADADTQRTEQPFHTSFL